MSELKNAVPHPAGLVPGIPNLAGYSFALTAVAATTAAIIAIKHFVVLGHVGAIYLVPILIAAIRWGLGPALFASGASVLTSAFFFYPPYYSFRIQHWDQIVDLALFTIVGIVTSHLVVTLRSHARTAERAINEAQMRAQTEHLRDALIGSVSHELRTPLSSILGATTVLSTSASVLAEPRLAALATVARDEAERLNNDIQNLLDATRISSEGLRPRFEWAEPADIVNAAVDRLRTGLGEHRIEIDLPGELPLVYVDPVLIRQALGQIIDNAAKYSEPGSPIRLGGSLDDGSVALSVSDHGAGLSQAEQERLGERFFRGARTAATTTGSGLGVWIAKAFVQANGGSLAVTSTGEYLGTTVVMHLPVPERGADQSELPHE